MEFKRLSKTWWSTFVLFSTFKSVSWWHWPSLFKIFSKYLTNLIMSYPLCKEATCPWLSNKKTKINIIFQWKYTWNGSCGETGKHGNSEEFVVQFELFLYLLIATELIFHFCIKLKYLNNSFQFFFFSHEEPTMSMPVSISIVQLL